MPFNFFRTKLFKVLVIVSFSVFLIIFNPHGFFNPVKTAFFVVFSPFQKVAYGLTFEASEIKKFIGSIGQLKKENEKLIEENRSLLAENSKFRGEGEENEKLREELQLLPREKFNLEGSAVISRDPNEQGGWIEIDKGERNGLKKDMPVIVNSGILVGKIEEVYPTTSKVLLVNDIGSSINAIDLKTGSRGIVKGEFGLGIIMDMVLQSEALNKGDEVATSGVGKVFPAGLLIGKIEEISPSSEGGLFQRAIVSSLIDFSRLQFVFVVKN